MRHTFAKMLGLLLILAMLLSGCNLIEVDMKMQYAEDKAKLEKDYATVLAEYDNGEITILDVLPEFNSEYNYLSQMYTYFGMSLTRENIETMRDDVVKNFVEMRVIAQEFDRRGLTVDPADTEDIPSADEQYQQIYNEIKPYAEGKTEAEKAAYLDYVMYAQGYTKEGLEEMVTLLQKQAAVEKMLRAEITDVTDEQLQEAYDAKVASDEETYSANPSALDTAMSDPETASYWMPEGYRTVKHILVVPQSETLEAFNAARTNYDNANKDIESYETEMDALKDADPETEQLRTEAEVQADIDAKRAELPALKTALDDAEKACIASVQTKLDEIYAKLAAGESFDAVMAEYGEDPGMKNAPAMDTGYYVSADSTAWDANFTKGAMLLEKVGDYSQTPAVTSSGVHIIYYNSDVAPGAVTLDSVRESLREATLEDMRDAHYNEEVAKWVAAANPVYHTEDWKLFQEQ